MEVAGHASGTSGRPGHVGSSATRECAVQPGLGAWAGGVVAGPRGPAVRQRPRLRITGPPPGFAPTGPVFGDAVRARRHLPRCSKGGKRDEAVVARRTLGPCGLGALLDVRRARVRSATAGG
ncbi:hypothetical protein SANT12839_041570 [Streptomyces antimycoticus]|uniref:Uncharacterized protein n=1 Tax=Streptomyces antimycoticus TaxID=68175 RepID=A0A4D4K2T7_9ACTN|nr:hypothetical protein SANT12839_041570 [Streptomyces antimycoticus]